ncbi:MAG: hypothetical protein H6R05_71 [Burkholderiaceae bacterium]|nr:hypothetical protein [Burkholderiaceae bacterium]
MSLMVFSGTPVHRAMSLLPPFGHPRYRIATVTRDESRTYAQFLC